MAGSPPYPLARIFLCLLLLPLVACEEEVETSSVELKLYFPVGQQPLDLVQFIKLQVWFDDDTPPTAQTFSLDKGAGTISEVPFGSRQFLVEGLDSPNGAVVARGGSSWISIDRGFEGTVPIMMGLVGNFGIATGAPSTAYGNGAFMSSGLRAGHAATLLNDGRVLITGGAMLVLAPDSSILLIPGVQSRAEIYDPNTGIFTPLEGMVVPRAFHTATKLKNGMVLITGGLSASEFETPHSVLDAEIYDPTVPPGQNPFYAVGGMMEPRAFHTATMLVDGAILVTGGINRDATGAETYLSTAEIYRPDALFFEPQGATMSVARAVHTATFLAQSGAVLVAGGRDSEAVHASAELFTFNESGGIFIPAGAMSTPRYGHCAERIMADGLGRVVIMGGLQGADDPDAVDAVLSEPVVALSSMEVFSPDELVFHSDPAWNMLTPRAFFTATSLPDGARILLVGGQNGHRLSLVGTEILWAQDNNYMFFPTGDLLEARFFHAAATLLNGNVLVAGGIRRALESDSAEALSSAEVYFPAP